MKRYLEVTGTGAAHQVPDRIDLHISVTATHPGIAEALAEVAHLSQALVNRLPELGLEPADIQTSSSSVHEDFAGPDTTPTGYRATHDLTLRLAEPALVPDVLEAAVETSGDAFRLNHLSWGITDEAALQSQARAAAVLDARGRAAELAELTGCTLGPILRVTESSYPSGSAPRLALMKSDSAGFAPERGTARVEISLALRFAIT